MRNKVGLTAGVATMVLACLWAGTAGSQELPPAPTTTTVAPDETSAPPTTVSEGVATTTTVAEQPGEGATPAQPDTTIVEPTPAEIAAIKLDPTALPGSRVSEGWMDFVVDFKESPARSCSGRIPVVPETQLNAVDGEGGRIGALYGTAPADKGTVGVFLVGLKAMPIGIAVLSGSNANCEFDAIGLGSFTSSNSEVHLDGIGLGLHPDAYDNGDFVRKFKIDASVSKRDATPVLDLGAAERFLLRKRPGLAIELPEPSIYQGTPTTTVNANSAPTTTVATAPANEPAAPPAVAQQPAA